jgi:hypothetical protein
MLNAMRLYLISPIIPAGADREAADELLKACIDPIAEVILGHIEGDPALFAIRHANESSDHSLPPARSYDYANVAEIPDTTTLLKVLKECLDPFSGKWSLIRSLVTCRTVCCDQDGGAYMLLPTDASVVESSDPTRISVKDVSPWLLESDSMDGLLRE